MGAKKKPAKKRATAAERAKPRDVTAPAPAVADQWTDERVRSDELRALVRASERWQGYAWNLRNADYAAGAAEMRIARVLRAVWAARSVADDVLIGYLETAASRVFRSLFEAGRLPAVLHFEASAEGEAAQFGVRDPAPAKGEEWGRASATTGVLSTIAALRSWRLSSDDMAQRLVEVCSNPFQFADEFAAKGLPLPDPADRKWAVSVRRQVEKEQQRGGDDEAVFRAAFRGLGFTAAQARDLLSFRDKQAKRRR